MRLDIVYGGLELFFFCAWGGGGISPHRLWRGSRRWHTPRLRRTPLKRIKEGQWPYVAGAGDGIPPAFGVPLSRGLRKASGLTSREPAMAYPPPSAYPSQEGTGGCRLLTLIEYYQLLLLYTSCMFFMVCILVACRTDIH